MKEGERTNVIPFDRTVLSNEEAQIVEAAQAAGDHRAIRNMRVIRAEMVGLLAETEMVGKEISTKALSHRFGVGEDFIRRTRESRVFKEELRGFIAERVLNTENMLTAERKFREALDAGQPWAIQHMLKKMGAEKSKSKESLENVI